MDLLTILRSQWDRVAAIVCVIAGIVTLILGYHGVASSPYVAEELAYLVSGGLGGVFLLGVGATLYMSADMHDEWRKLDRIEAAILKLADGESPSVEAETDRSGTDRSARAYRPTPVPAGAVLRVQSGGAALVPRDMLRNLGVSAAAALVALAFLVSGYLRAATVTSPSSAFTATAIAVVGLVVCGFGAAAGPLRLRRRLRVRRSVLLRGFLERAATKSETVAPVAGGTRALVGIPGGRYVHLADCVMLAAAEKTLLGADELAADVERCALCLGADR